MARAGNLARNMFGQQKLLINNDPVFGWRERFTIAQINAGATLLNAVPGYKYEIQDFTLIAVGGNVGAATDVRILGTRNGASVALAIAAIAALTRSTVVKPNTANVTVLADGASFAEVDANTPLTVGKTGANITTATHIDVIIQYRLVKTGTGPL